MVARATGAIAGHCPSSLRVLVERRYIVKSLTNRDNWDVCSLEAVIEL